MSFNVIAPPNEGYEATTKKLVLKSGPFMDNVLQKGVDFLSAVFSLNGAVTEPSQSGSSCQAHLTVDTIENVIRGGGGDCADGGAMARQQDELDGSINYKPLIDDLLIKKAVSEKKTFCSFC